MVCLDRDPNPRVRGKGLSQLKGAGIAITRLNIDRDPEALNRGFYSRMRRFRPWVILKSALSIDGKAAAATGQSRWITGPSARAAVLALRAEVDAILVGAGTVLTDNPVLSAHGAGKNPLRVVLAGRRRLPARARVFDSSAQTIVYKARTRTALLAAMKDLSRRGVGTLLVEGGPTVHAAFLRAGLVDEARVFIAPKLLSGCDDPNAAPTLKTPKLSRLGADWLIEGVV